MTDFIESLEDDFGFYEKNENVYFVVDEYFVTNRFSVICLDEEEYSKLWILQGDSRNLETLARTIETSIKVMEKNLIPYFSNLAEKYDKKLLGLSKVDEKHDKYWLVECNVCSTQSSLRSRFFDRCLGCNTSKGEKRIARYLKEKKIHFIPQETFDDLRYINLLKLDFYVPSLNTAIEYQGEQHTSIGYYIRRGIPNPEKAFRDCQLRDQAKRDWCKKRGIRLIEIHYYQFRKIEAVLDELLFGIAV